MTKKTLKYAVLEAAAAEMRADPSMIWIHELTPPVAASTGMPPIDLEAEFGSSRVINTGTGEDWMVQTALRAGSLGVRVAIYIPYQDVCRPFHVIQRNLINVKQIIRRGLSIPVTFIMEMTGQTPGLADRHPDYDFDSYDALIPDIRTVIPSTAYDAKGLMVSALRTCDPVVYLYPSGLQTLCEDVPDDQYEVPLNKAAVRQVGNDITIVGSGKGMPDVLKAAKRLTVEGMSVEVIDLRALREMDVDTLAASVAKTRRLLAVDPAYYTLGTAAEVVARCAQNVEGACLRQIAFPDSPPRALPEMFRWMKPNSDHIAAAARRML